MLQTILAIKARVVRRKDGIEGWREVARTKDVVRLRCYLDSDRESDSDPAGREAEGGPPMFFCTANLCLIWNCAAAINML
jgi:hypothetical protein